MILLRNSTSPPSEDGEDEDEDEQENWNEDEDADADEDSDEEDEEGVCVSLSCNYLALVVSLCCSTGVRCGAFGSEYTM